MFFDGISEQLFDEIPKSPLVRSQVLLNIDKFEIGQSYVTAKIQNRYAENVTIKIQGGRPGIELQDSLFKIKNPENQDFTSRGGSRTHGLCRFAFHAGHSQYR